jgi:hypothetical protein
MKSNTLATTLVALGLTTTALADDGLVNFAPLYKDSVASSAGTEMVHPYLKVVDANADGLPEATMRFNIYPMDSSVLLFSTALRSVPFPVPPCDPATTNFVDFGLGEVKFQGDGNLFRSHMAVSLHASCADAGGYKEAFKTVVYSASINVPPTDPSATVWLKTYPLDLFGFDSRFFTAENRHALVLSLGVRVAPTAFNPEPVNLRSISLNIEDGAVLFDVTRALTR